MLMLLKAKLYASMRERLALRWSFVFEVAGTCSSLAIFLLIDRFQGAIFGDQLRLATEKLGTSYFGYVTVGLAVSSLASSSLGGVLGQFSQEKRLRTLPLVLASPLSLWRWAVIAGMANLVRAVFQFLLIFAVAVGLMGLRFPSFSLGSAFLVILISIPSLWALSVLSLSIALLIRRGDPLGFLLGLSLEILGGVYVPIDVLPEWVRGLARLIPLGPSLEAMHKVLSSGAVLTELASQLTLLGVLAGIYLPFAYAMLAFADRKARLNGNYFLS